MKRILLLIVRLIAYIPGWLYKIHYYNHHLEDTSFEERFAFVQKMIRKINSKSRVRMHCYGKENIPTDQGCLFTPNHQGLFDSLIMFETLDQPFSAVLKIELMDVMVLKDVIRILEFEAMDRSNLRASVKVIKNITKKLSQDLHCIIFPEGTRCRQQNEMLEFKGGSFKAAMDSHKPIVPVALIDCYKVFDNNSIAPVDAQIHYLSPLYYEDYKDMSSNEIAVVVQTRIRQCIEDNEKNIYE